LTKGLAGAMLSKRLETPRPDVIEELLTPLRYGRSVVLQVADKRLPRKTRSYPTMLVITPMVQLGGSPQQLLIAMPPYGSEVFDIQTELRGSKLARLGLSFTMADALSKALQKILWRIL